MNARFALWLFCAFASLAPVAAWAHPHSWIDIEVEVLFDGEGRVRALRQDWIF
ncbi:MAG: DUF1007 family protein, partial [Alphaproteobacteria bacterium]|nr:DUF1007 family protein [Alphaproteobacteria bacterium]